MNLYRVTLRGSIGEHEVSYVVAPDPREAYSTVLADLWTRGIGVDATRELRCVELIATDAKYPACKCRLRFAGPAVTIQPDRMEP